MRRSVLFVLALAAVGCHVSAEAKSGGGMNADVNPTQSKTESTFQTTSTPPPPVPTTSAAPPPPLPSVAPPDACPLSCYVASGGDRIPVTDQELANIRSGLEPVLGRMRACADIETWRRKGSPTVQLRVAPDGSAAEVDVDPTELDDPDVHCMDAAAKGSTVAVSLPGRTTVRCVERCTTERAPKTKKKK